MSFLTKLMDTMRLDNDEDDDYFLDDDYVEDEKPAKKSIFNKKPAEDDDFDDFDELHERCVKEAKHLNGAITFPSSMRGKKLAELEIV